MKLKYIFSALLVIGLTAQAEDKKFEKLDSKESLPLIFEKSVAAKLDKQLADDLFFVHVKSIEYALSEGQKDDVISWEGPEKALIGKVTVTGVDQKALCKDFIQNITLKEETFEGKGTGCLVDGAWMVKRK